MNDIVGFLGTHQEIRELLLVMGTKSSAALVYDVCSMVKLDRLVLAVPDTELKKEVQKAVQRLRYETADYVPDAFRLASVVCGHLEKYLKKQMDEVEIGYLAMHIQRVAAELE